MPVRRLEGRLRLGWSFDSAVEAPKKQFYRASKPYQLPENLSVRNLADQYNVNHRRVYERLKNGWSMEEALEMIPRVTPSTTRCKEVSVSGRSFRSHASAAKHFAVNIGTWRKRLSLGWSLEQAAGVEPRP